MHDVPLYDQCMCKYLLVHALAYIGCFVSKMVSMPTECALSIYRGHFSSYTSR